MISRKKHLGAFTLVELLVVIAIIGVLVALLLPAIQAARESARKSKCVNNLRQFGVALHDFHGAAGHFPRGGINGWSLDHNKYTGDAFKGWTDDHGSWVVRILPYIEQQTIFDTMPDLLDPDLVNPIGTWAISVNDGAPPPPIPIGRCASDDFGFTEPFFNYSGCTGPIAVSAICGANGQAFDLDLNSMGIDIPWVDAGFCALADEGGSLDACPETGMFSRVGYRKISIRHVTDGTSNTLFVGETLVGKSAHSFDIAQLTNKYWAGNDTGTAHAGTIPPINWPILEEASTCGAAKFWRQNYHVTMGFESNHPGGANFLKVDSSVAFLSDAIDFKAYQLLGTKDDGQVIDKSSF